VHVRDCGRPVGTRIEVTHLFNSVPARRKFLKSDTTEAAHIIHGVRLYALAFPQVAFTLIEDGRVIFKSPQCATLVERIAGIFGKQTAEGLFALEADEPGMKLRGLVGQPGVGRATRHEMICFVNQRPVDSRTLNYALIESFHESLPKGRYPVAFVFFEIDPAAVDVNVHPAKREVRFRSESAVRAFVIRAVLGRLREISERLAPARAEGLGVTAIGDSGQIAHLPGTAVPLLPQVRSSTLVDAGLRTRDNALSSALPPAVLSKPGFGAPPVVVLPSPLRVNAGEPTSAVPRSATAWRFLGLAHGAYALFETPAGLVLLDRRAAHERIWFERLQAQFRSGVVPSQRLLLPVPMELDPIAAALLLDRLGFFNGHGFEIVEFGRNFFRIEGVPDWMAVADAEPFVRDLLGALREGRLQDKNVDVAREELARLAVAKAIRLPEVVGEVELHGVLMQLFACRSPLTSPSGRPTQIEFSLGELARRFQK
jgi:DNA mismatch repair protein MutL